MATSGYVDEWMKQNNLSEEVCDVLREKEVEMHELLEMFNDGELDAFCDEIGFNSIQKRRLLKALKSWESKQNVQKMEKNKSLKESIIVRDNQRRTILITQEENDQYDKLDRKQKEVDKLMEHIHDVCKSLDGECERVIKEINEYFDEYVKILRQKQKDLLMNIDTIYKYKNEGFDKQSIESNKYLDHITKV